MSTIPLVFLVDDDENDEELARVALEQSEVPHRLQVARNGVEALNQLLGRGPASSAPPELPQVVLLDLKLPKLNGLEVLQALRKDKRTQTVPVVVFTSSAEERDVGDAYRNGANGYVRKPVDFQEYKALIVDFGRYWLSRNQIPDVLPEGTT